MGEVDGLGKPEVALAITILWFEFVLKPHMNEGLREGSGAKS